MNDRQAKISISVGLVLLVGLAFFFLRENTEAVQEYRVADISEFANPYVGNNTNTVEALRALPLGERIEAVEIRGTEVIAIATAGDDLTADRVDVLHSAITFFALIDNATSLTYQIGGQALTVERAAVEERFGAPLRDLLTDTQEWNRVVTLIPIEAYALVN